MDYELVAANVRASYREVSPKYRQDDEVEVTTENHHHYSSILRHISSSFDRPIDVLDVGCGTGRYFHCLQNATQLIGIDVSPDMLEAAESPVRESEITAEEIQLICDNIFLISFPPASFDFIYSVGMFGYGCPVTLEVCNRFYDWLKPGGRLFFNVLDFRTLSRRRRIRKRLGRIVYHLLPSQMKRRLDDRDDWLPFFWSYAEGTAEADAAIGFSPVRDLLSHLRLTALARRSARVLGHKVTDRGSRLFAPVALPTARLRVPYEEGSN